VAVLAAGAPLEWRSGFDTVKNLARGARRIVLRAMGLLALAVAASAWAQTPPSPADFPTLPAAASEADYRIGALDKLDITVFQVKDLTIDKLQVDASGQILLPLIGSVIAKGKTTTELSAEIAARLAEHYLQSPQVSVTVDEAVSQKVSVEGSVNEAGVFELKGRTSLLEAVARAKGMTKGANAHKVTIIRNVDGTPHAANFDLVAIGQGKARNPEVVGNDVVIVDGSQTKSAWRSFIEVMPALYWLSFL